MAVIALSLLCGVACHRESAASVFPPLVPAAFSGDRAFREVESFVALGPKVAGTDAARRVALHLRHRLEELGVAAEIDEFSEATPSGTNQFRNVIGRFPGSSDLIILIAHYDTKGGIGERFVGANDSGSGVGVLLELARVLKAGRTGRAGGDAPPVPRPSVWIAFLDGEECRVAYGPSDGLHGSRRLARQASEAGGRTRVKAVILLDMVGDRDLTVTIPRNSTPELTRLAFEAAQAEGVRPAFSLYPGSILDDHVPFLSAGMPAIDLIDFEYGSGARKNDFWHTEKDTMDKLSAESLATVGRVVIRMVNALSP
jgi:glutaminyl-peptide cyclotransferase